MYSVRFCGLVAVLALALMPVPVCAATVILLPSQDNTLYEDPTGSLSNGAGPGIFAGDDGSPLKKRAVIRFPIAEKIPKGSIITSATLQLYMSRSKSETDQNIEFHRLSASWGEGTSFSDGMGGQGGQATTGDATWTYRFYNTVSWIKAGGDFAPVPTLVQPIGPIGFYSIGPVTPLTQDIQLWLNNPSQNNGWILIGNETTDSTAKRFESKESATPSQAPRLFVDFIAPASSVQWPDQ